MNASAKFEAKQARKRKQAQKFNNVDEGIDDSNDDDFQIY